MAQDEKLSLSIGYFAPFGVNFGGQAGVVIPYKELRSSEKGTYRKRLLLNPHVAYFARPDVERNFLINLKSGLEMRKAERKFYFFPSLGVGYLHTVRTLGGTVNLGTGDFSRQTESINAFLPTINLELGSSAWKSFGYFGNLYYGREITSGQSNAGFFGIEFGFKYHLKGTDVR